jgi:hypothetical protein
LRLIASQLCGPVRRAGGDIALVLYNKGEFPINITVDLSDVMAFNASARNASSGGTTPLFKARVHDLFTDETSDATFNITALDVPPHGSAMYRVSAMPSGWIPNTGNNQSSLVAASCGANPGILLEFKNLTFLGMISS